MALHFDLVRFPLVICRLSEVECPVLSLQSQSDAYLTELVRHRGVFACVHDWTQAGELGPERWRCVFERAILSAALSSQCVAQAIAVTNPALRSFATARTLENPFSYALRVAGSFESALSWCAWQLKRSEPQAV
jgi:hypothetical protein